MNKKMKRETIIGLACLAISLTSTRFDLIPMFISGALMGCAMLLIILGFLPEKARVSLKQWKKCKLHGKCEECMAKHGARNKLPRCKREKTSHLTCRCVASCFPVDV